MATNPLRTKLTEKYNTTVASPTATSQTKNELRSSLEAKYAAPTGPVITGGALTPVQNTNPNNTPKSTPSLREQLANKYTTPTDTSQVGVQQASDLQTKKDTQGIIASPEYFATSVDVRSSTGKFLETFKGKNPGEAQAAANEYAQKVGGSVQVTPPLGALGKIFTRAQETFKASLDNLTAKGNKLTSTLGDPNASKASRAASSVDLGVAGIEALLSPISAVFSAAEEVPVAGGAAQGVNYIFGKVGQAGGWVGNTAVDSLPVSDKTKAEIRPAVENLSVLLSQLAAGKLSAKATETTIAKTEQIRSDIRTAITKDVIETNQLPKTVYVSAESVKSIFQTGEKISPDELQLVKSLGLSAEQYKTAVKEGVSIAVPAEKIVTIIDKPWFAKVKGVFGLKPSSETIIDSAGKPVKAPETRDSRLIDQKGTNGAPDGPQGVKTVVQDAISSPITPKLLDKISLLSPEETSAFGKKLVDTINEAVGIKIAEGAAKQLPSNVDMIQTPSGDGRPAQFKNGRIEIFMPDLFSDLQSLAAGNKILAHQGEYSTVYQKLPNESMEDLSVRYVRDIILHEASHQKTMTFADAEAIRNYQRRINEAKLSGNKRGSAAARQELTKYMSGLEDKANAYMRSNRQALEKELFGGGRKTSTEIQRKLNKGVDGKIPSRTKPDITEKKVLTDKIKARAKGAKEGYSAGKKVGAETQREIAKTAREKLLETIRDRKSTVKKRQDDLADYAKILPFRERGKFIDAIKNAKSEKDFLDVLRRITDASKSVERANLIASIQKSLKDARVKIRDGRPSAKLSADKQSIINDIKSLQSKYEAKAKELRASGDTEASAYKIAQTQIIDKIADWQVKHPDEVLPVEILHETELLRMVGLKDMTLEELSSVASSIESIIEEGKTKRELDRFNLETERQRAHDAFLKVIKAGKELPSSKEGIKQVQARRAVQEILDKVSEGKLYLVDAWEEIMDNISKFDKGSNPYESFVSKYGRVVKDARGDEYRGEKKTINSINESVKKIYKIEDKQIIDLLSDLRKIVDLGELKLADGTVKNFKVSRGQAMKYNVLFKDQTLDPTFEKQGWTNEVKDKIRSVMSKEDAQMSEWFVNEFYRDYYKRINEVHVKDTGVDLPYNENYTPLARDIGDIIPDNVLLAKETIKYATARTGSLKQRVDNTLSIEPTDIFSEAISHTIRMEHYIAWQEHLNNLRSVFGNKEIRQAVRELHGEAKMKFIDNALNDFARGGVAREKIVTAVDKMRINATKAMLGLNLNVAKKQIAGVSNYLIELDTAPFLTGVADFWLNPMKNMKFLSDNSVLFNERYASGWERDIKAATQAGYDKQIAGKKNFSEMMFFMIRYADKFTVVQGAHAAYRDGINKGMTKEEAIKYSEDITERTQESSAMDTLSDVQRGGSWAKLFTMFQGQPVKYLRIMNNAARNIRYGRGSRVRNTKRLIMAWIIAPLIYSIVANQIADEKYKKSAGELGVRALYGPLTYIPATGAIAQTLIDKAFGDRFDFSASPAFAFIGDMNSAVEQFMIGDVIDSVTYLADSIGKLRGVPTTIVTKRVRNALKDSQSTGGGGSSVSF